MAPRRKRQRLSVSGLDAITDFDDEEVEEVEQQDLQPIQPAKHLQSRSLFVRSLPPNVTTATLAEHFSQSFPLKHAMVVVDPQTKISKGYGFVTLADIEDAHSAKDKFDGSIFQDRIIKVEVAEPRHRDMKGDDLARRKRNFASADATETKAERVRQIAVDYRAPKLIVRNLPWTIKEPDQLAAIFRSFGKVKHATLPKKRPGLSGGFGFVVLRGRKNAEKALEAVNGRDIEGRTLAVDWAVEKEIWETLNNGVKDTEGWIKPANVLDIEGSNIAKSKKGEDLNLDELASSDDGKHNSSDGQKIKVSIGEEPNEVELPQSISSTLFVRNLPFTATDDTLKAHFESFGPIRYARIVLDRITERSKGTGFVCFYNHEDAGACLREALSLVSQAGKANQFDKSKAAHSFKHSLLEDISTDPAGHFSLEGRVLQVTRAVDRTEATRLTIAGKSLRDMQDKDKRRLYLLSEGTIPPNSPLYNKLAPSEINLREESAKQRQILVKNNPTLHLSLTRLSIRNLPRNITSKDLKALAREAAVGFAKDVKAGIRQHLSEEEVSRGGEELKEAERARKAKGKGIVKQAKIVFEGREGTKVAESSGAGRSRGYGFIEFSSHRWALMGLRWLNGHTVGHPPSVTNEEDLSREAVKDKRKRLVVEFAIENAQVVTRRHEREAKARERSKLVLDKRQKGEMPRATVKVLTRNTLMAKSWKGSTRNKASGRTSIGTSEATPATVNPDSAKEMERLAKRQKIIEKKRMVRRSRNKVTPRQT